MIFKRGKFASQEFIRNSGAFQENKRKSGRPFRLSNGQREKFLPPSSRIGSRSHARLPPFRNDGAQRRSGPRLTSQEACINASTSSDYLASKSTSSSLDSLSSTSIPTSDPTSSISTHFSSAQLKHYERSDPLSSHSISADTADIESSFDRISLEKFTAAQHDRREIHPNKCAGNNLMWMNNEHDTDAKVSRPSFVYKMSRESKINKQHSANINLGKLDSSMGNNGSLPSLDSTTNTASSNTIIASSSFMSTPVKTHFQNGNPSLASPTISIIRKCEVPSIQNMQAEDKTSIDKSDHSVCGQIVENVEVAKMCTMSLRARFPSWKIIVDDNDYNYDVNGSENGMNRDDAKINDAETPPKQKLRTRQIMESNNGQLSSFVSTPRGNSSGSDTMAELMEKANAATGQKVDQIKAHSASDVIDGEINIMETEADKDNAVEEEEKMENQDDNALGRMVFPRKSLLQVPNYNLDSDFCERVPAALFDSQLYHNSKLMLEHGAADRNSSSAGARLFRQPRKSLAMIFATLGDNLGLSESPASRQHHYLARRQRTNSAISSQSFRVDYAEHEQVEKLDGVGTAAAGALEKKTRKNEYPSLCRGNEMSWKNADLEANRQLSTGSDEDDGLGARSLFIVDILCCTCCTRNDEEEEYLSLIENHKLARMVTLLAVLTILGLVLAYIIRSVTEDSTPDLLNRHEGRNALRQSFTSAQLSNSAPSSHPA
ncbi:unnamed protein product, partial [Protopolystoma xenopodis]